MLALLKLCLHFKRKLVDCKILQSHRHCKIFQQLLKKDYSTSENTHFFKKNLGIVKPVVLVTGSILRTKIYYSMIIFYILSVILHSIQTAFSYSVIVREGINTNVIIVNSASRSFSFNELQKACCPSVYMPRVHKT